MAEDRSGALDEMIEFATEELLSGSHERRRALVRRMAQRWADEPALALCYALTSASEGIADALPDREREPAILVGFRLSALISADIHAVQAIGQVPAQSEDLLQFWRRSDPAFLRLT